MKTYLHVPYEEKDRAKLLGARWDPTIKQWYVPLGLSLAPFSRWLNKSIPTAVTLPSHSFADLLPSWLPSFCFGTKLGAFIKPADLSALKKNLLNENHGCCSICQAQADRLMLYPDWIYKWGEHPIQKLKEILLLCEKCLQVKYYGINRMQGSEEFMLAHLTKVRGCSKRDAMALVRERENLFFKLSSVEWDLDVSVLTEMGLQVDEAALENEKRRRKSENKINTDAVIEGLKEGWY